MNKTLTAAEIEELKEITRRFIVTLEQLADEFDVSVEEIYRGLGNGD